MCVWSERETTCVRVRDCCAYPSLSFRQGHIQGRVNRAGGVGTPIVYDRWSRRTKTACVWVAAWGRCVSCSWEISGAHGYHKYMQSGNSWRRRDNIKTNISHASVPAPRNVVRCAKTLSPHARPRKVWVCFCVQADFGFSALSSPPRLYPPTNALATM